MAIDMMSEHAHPAVYRRAQNVSRFPRRIIPRLKPGHAFNCCATPLARALGGGLASRLLAGFGLAVVAVGSNHHEYPLASYGLPHPPVGPRHSEYG